jgi:8-oxo-dGTP diphosphatase
MLAVNPSGDEVFHDGPMEYTDYDTRLAAYAVVVDDDERVLLALWNEAHERKWTLPGGGVDFEETVEDGAVREVREETGYVVVLDRLLGLETHAIPVEDRLSDTDRPMKAVRVVFEATVVGGELTHEADGTTDEARWFPLSEVAALPRVGLVDIGLDLWRQR